MMMTDNSFGGYDDEENDVFIPLEATESDFDKLREDILDRISRGLRPSSVIPQVNPFIISRLPHNPFIFRVSVPGWQRQFKYKNLKPPTEADIIESVTTQVIKVPPELRDSFVERLDSTITEIRAFLITEIAPIVIGFDTASDESVQMLRLITEDENLSLNTRKVQEIFKELMTIKLAKYLSGLLSIDNSTHDKVVDAYLAKYMTPVQKQSSGADTSNFLNRLLANSGNSMEKPKATKERVGGKNDQ